MTTCRQLSNEICVGTCGGETLHDEGGCIHRKTCGGARQAKNFRPLETTDYDELRARKEQRPVTGVDSLTTLERKVLLEFGRGGNAGSVAKRVGLTTVAVRGCRTRICKKLGLVLTPGLDVVVEFARNLGFQRLEA